MSLGFVFVAILLLLRFVLYRRPLRNFYVQFLFGIALPYLGILSFWSVHMIHAGLDIERLFHMTRYWDFPISSALIFIFFANIFYASYRITREIKQIEREILTLPHRRFKNLVVLKSTKPLAFTLGIFKPKLFLSEGVFKLDNELRKLIINHEINHIRSFDNLKIFLFSLLIPSKKELSLFKAQLEILNDNKILKKYPKNALVRALILSLNPPNLGLGIADEICIRFENLEKTRKENPLIYVPFVLSLVALFYLSTLNCKG